ncbi:MAG TPA: CHAT domain-containing tetratricopeptide repeat protein [Cytophagaceae bacterium]|jgi:CHAT domain-containing protein/Tfp pilus assembly protein PilF|nr:CHAT domain-containing tetratricopeptide repeat protein [Cytophagaceae bacterium]
MNKISFSLIASIFLFFGALPNTFSQIKKDTLEARKLFYQADSLCGNAKYEESFLRFHKAAEIYKKYALWKPYFICQSRIAENFSNQSLYDEALNLSTNSLVQIHEKKLTHTEFEAVLLNQLGFAYLNKGRNDLALENFKKSLDIFNSLSNANKIEFASCYENLGIANWNAMNNELALEHLQKSLQLRKNVYGEGHPEVADAYNNIGLVYTANDPDKALGYYIKALEVYEKVYGSSHPKVIRTYNNIAIIQRKQKKYDEALGNFQKALSVWEQNDKNRNPTVAFVYTNVAQLYYDKGELSKAMDFQLKALEIYKENYGAKHPEIAVIYNQIGSIYSSQNNFKEALKSYQEAICANVSNFDNKNVEKNPSMNHYYNAVTLLYSLQSKAHTLETQYHSKTLKMKDLQLSLTTFYSCDTLIEKIRKVQTNKNDKIELGKIAASVYEDAIRVCISLKNGGIHKKTYEEQAFYFSEKSKAAILLEAISESDAKHFASIPDSLLENEKNIKSEISFYEQKLAEKSDPMKEQFNRDKLFSLNREYENFISKMERQFPEYYNLKYNIKTTSVKSIQKLLDDASVLISYFIAEESKRVYIFYISNKKLNVYDVPENNQLTKLLIGYRNSIRLDAEQIYLETAQQLYKQLFPFSIHPSLEKMIIIPDGKLGTIPFESLQTHKINPTKTTPSQYPYLIKKCAVVYSYSANLFEQTMLKISSTNESLFLCAPISFSGFEGHYLNDLPSTNDEVNSIKKMFSEKGITCKSYKGKDVQESMIKSGELERYKFLHFATHGIVNENNPELSEIYLSPDTTKKEDGNLYSGEIYNLKMNADLVTLSACQTGLGKVQRGEGIIGLTRALLFAGAKNLIVSLWSVSDKSTSLLMIDFYEEMLKNPTAAYYGKSLQTAKLKMIQECQYSRPYFWAPFILVGR